ncbi:MAG: DUF4886 domain-containing protein [Akkermansiaceae bacterium]
MNRLLIILTLCISTLTAKETLPTLHSRSENKKIHATPIEVKGKSITFKRANNTTFTLEIDKFALKDQAKLNTWRDAMITDPHHKLVNRVETTEHLKILFIGNSYSFNVPKAFEKIATSKHKKITVEQVTIGGCTLLRHSQSKELLTKIKNTKYDIIILQEQSQTPSIPEQERSKVMDKAANILVTAIKESGAIPVFFQTWGRKNGDKANKALYPNDTFTKMQTRLTTGYTNVAKACGGNIHIIPVGELWQKNIKTNPKSADKLFQKDGSHPAQHGVTYTAEIFYSALYNEPIHKTTPHISDLAQFHPIPYN